MTDTTADPSTVEAPEQPPGPARAAPDTDQPEPTSSHREARYRRELRAAESERDTLREQVQGLQRAEAERLSGLSKPGSTGRWLGRRAVNVQMPFVR